jgi:hypothetical protein
MGRQSRHSLYAANTLRLRARFASKAATPSRKDPRCSVHISLSVFMFRRKCRKTVARARSFPAARHDATNLTKVLRETPRWRDRDSNPRSPVECNIFRDCPVRAFRARPSVREEGSSARVQGLESRFPPPSEVSRAIPQRSRTPCQEPLARRRSCRRASRRCRAQFFACPVRCRGRRIGLSRFRVLWCGCGGRVLRLYGLRRDF